MDFSYDTSNQNTSGAVVSLVPERGFSSSQRQMRIPTCRQCPVKDRAFKLECWITVRAVELRRTFRRACLVQLDPLAFCTLEAAPIGSIAKARYADTTPPR